MQFCNDVVNGKYTFIERYLIKQGELVMSTQNGLHVLYYLLKLRLAKLMQIIILSNKSNTYIFCFSMF